MRCGWTCLVSFSFFFFLSLPTWKAKQNEWEKENKNWGRKFNPLRRERVKGNWWRGKMKNNINKSHGSAKKNKVGWEIKLRMQLTMKRSWRGKREEQTSLHEIISQQKLEFFFIEIMENAMIRTFWTKEKLSERYSWKKSYNIWIKEKKYH